MLPLVVRLGAAADALARSQWRGAGRPAECSGRHRGDETRGSERDCAGAVHGVGNAGE